MRKYKIFVSGVQQELKKERLAIKDFVLNDALLSEYFDVFLFEDAPAKSKSVEISYLEELKKSDIYIGILGIKYGNTAKCKLSPTDVEFHKAKELHKTILIYIKGKNGINDKKREEGVQNLIKEIRNSKSGFSYKRFRDITEFTRLVYASLIEFLKENSIVGRGGFDERICEDATFVDIDEEKVRWFVRVARDTRKFSLAVNTPVKDVLTHLNLLRKNKLTNAAILLFGKNPHRFFLQAEVKCVHLLGTEVYKPFPSYKIYSENLFEQVDKSVAFVLDIIKQAVIQQEHTPQFNRPFEIPVFAIQEAIVNAIVHRNYNVSSGVQVMVFTNRIEVWNSGSLPPELTIEDLRKPHTSFPANPLLANAFYLADYIQKTGSGTLEMIRQCRAQGASEPEFVLIRNVEFRTILPRDIFTESVISKLGLNERQLKAVQYVKEKGKITNKEYQENFGLKKRQATDDLKGLEQKNIFQKVGTTGRGTYYVLRGANGAKGAEKGR